MNNSDIFNQVKAILKSDKTSYKRIDVGSIPNSILQEFLHYHRNDVSESVKQSYIPNLVKYGFLAHSSLKQVNTPTVSTVPRVSSYSGYTSPVSQPSSYNAPQQSNAQQFYQQQHVSQYQQLNTVTRVGQHAGHKGCGTCPDSVV